MFFWLLAIPSLLFAQAAWATLVGSAVVMGLAIAAAARLAWRAGGIALCVIPRSPRPRRAVRPGSLMRPWNPNTAQPFYPLLLLLVAGPQPVIWGSWSGWRWSARSSSSPTWDT